MYTVKSLDVYVRLATAVMWHVWGKRKGGYRILVRKPEEKRQFGRPGRRWEDNIKTGLQEIAWWHGLDYLAQDSVRWVIVNMATNFWVPPNAGNFLTS